MVTTNAPIITLRDVRFTYDGGATWALDGVSLDIRRGERICLAGPNGSGKSTLSRVIAGLVAPDEGYVVLSGNVVFDECGAHADEYRTARCGIGAVFQHPEDQIVTTVTEDDVAFGPENLAIEHDEIGLRISGSLDAVDMSDYRASDPTRMSGGQQQRIAIAGMLAGAVTVVVWKNLIAPLGGWFAVYELLPGFLLALLVIVVVSKLTKEPSKEVTDDFDTYMELDV